MHRAAVERRDDPVHRHGRLAAGPDRLLGKFQRRLQRVGRGAQLALHIGHHVVERRAHAADAGHTRLESPGRHRLGIGRVAARGADAVGALVDVGAFHAQRREQALIEQNLEVLAGAARQRVGKQHQREVGIFEGAARRACQLHPAQRRVQHLCVHGGIGIVRVGDRHARRQRRQAAGVGDDVPKQDRLPLEVGQLRAFGQPVGQGIVERGAAGKDFLRQHGGDHGLADRTDLEGGVGTDAGFALAVGAAERPRDAARFNDGDGQAGAGAVAVQALLQCGGDGSVVHGKCRAGQAKGHQGNKQGLGSHGGHLGLGTLAPCRSLRDPAAVCDESRPAADEIRPGGVQSASRRPSVSR